MDQKRKVNKVDEQQTLALKKEMVKIDATISKILPTFSKNSNHDLEYFLLNTVDLAPKSDYRKKCVDKINKLIDIIELIHELKESIEAD